MSKFNADSLFEPIEITLGGKTYVVNEITYEMMSEVSRVTEQREKLEQQRDQNPDVEIPDNSILDLQLSVYLGCPAEELKGVDIRAKMAVAKFFRRCITEVSDEKNEPSATAS